MVILPRLHYHLEANAFNNVQNCFLLVLWIATPLQKVLFDTGIPVVYVLSRGWRSAAS